MVKKAKPTEFDWTQHVKNLLKSELKYHNMTYADLVLELDKIGVQDTEVNIRNKVARGMFTAVFFFQCLKAMGVERLELKR